MVQGMVLPTSAQFLSCVQVPQSIRIWHCQWAGALAEQSRFGCGFRAVIKDPHSFPYFIEEGAERDPQHYWVIH